jgi:GntR family transcriptional regulator, transcriptional repressor for pyruvate dehydrogenase complex
MPDSPGDSLSSLSLKKAARPKLTEVVAQQLLEAISVLPEGARVPSERELTRELGVGRSTLREALHGLALLGEIEIRHGQGVFVAKHSSDARELAALTAAITQGVTRDLLEARKVIEVEVARLAGQRRTESEIGDLGAILRAHESCIAKGQSPAAEGMRFHLTVGYAAHNEVLAAVMKTFRKPMFERGPRLYDDLEGFSEWELSQHTGIYRAIRDQNAGLAAKRMAAHIAAMAGHYQRAGEA